MRAQRRSRPSSLIFLASTFIALSNASGAAEHVVRIVSDYESLRMVFEPKHLEIESGDTVTWVNEANEEHNIVTYPDGYPRDAEAFQSPIMTRAGERFSHTFELPGTYEYHCIPHLPMGMHGQIIVGRPSENGEFHQPSKAEMQAYRDLLLEWFEEDEFRMLERGERAGTAQTQINVAVKSCSQKTSATSLR